MTKSQKAPATGFTAAEREYIRGELNRFFSTYPSVAKGFQLQIWHGGPQAGSPKIPPAGEGLLERGLVRFDASGRLPRLFFTDAGLGELRFADPAKFAHIRQELAIDPRIPSADAGA